MPNISGSEQSSRIERVMLIVKQATEGISEIEVAEHFPTLHRKTINIYLRKLSDRGMLYKDGKLWYFQRYREIVLRKISLEPEEALTLYLATRLLVKHTDRRNEIAETVLHKLAEILYSDAGIHETILSSAQELRDRPEEENYQDIYRIVMSGALLRVPVEITYEPFRSRSFTTVIHPYLIEPSVIGYATYVIGYSEIVSDLRTYKLERIQHARLLSGQHFDILGDFPGLDILKNAWSIFHGDETLEVVLRFHPDVAGRVRETNWHPSMELVDDVNYLLMRLTIADTTDLKPWIRTWGANCEVLEPQELREEMEGEARALSKLYGIDKSSGNAFDDIFGD